MPSYTVKKDGQKKRRHGTRPPGGSYPVPQTLKTEGDAPEDDETEKLAESSNDKDSNEGVNTDATG